MKSKTLKSLPSHQSFIGVRISISEKSEILKTESETAETLIFLKNVVNNLNISRYSEQDCVAENMTKPALGAILKYKDHPSILAIQSHCEAKTFRFTEVNVEDIKKEILKLNKNKASQVLDVPVKVIKDNGDIFAGFICENIDIIIT